MNVKIILQDKKTHEMDKTSVPNKYNLLRRLDLFGTAKIWKMKNENNFKF